MDIVKKLLSEMDDKTKSDIYLREIALLMEQIDDLKGKIRVKENIIKSFKQSPALLYPFNIAVPLNFLQESLLIFVIR